MSNYNKIVDTIKYMEPNPNTPNNQKVDALLFTELKNGMSSSYINSSGLSTQFNPPDPSNSNQYYNNILSQTALKKICCMNSQKPGSLSTFTTTVKIPVPSGYNYGDNPNADVWKKFGYIKKNIEVPSSICNSIGSKYNYNATQTCDPFMSLYCNNVIQFYQDELANLGEKYDPESVATQVEFAKYSPECACYLPQPKWIPGTQNPTCFLQGCGDGNSYQPANARKSCSNITFCNSVASLKTGNVGGSITFNPKITQNCGGKGTAGVAFTTVGGKTTGTFGTDGVKTSYGITTLDKVKQSFTKEGKYIGFIAICFIIIIFMGLGLLLAFM
jgi:hypothetical protein